MSGGTAKSTSYASGALASLASKHTDNRTAIAKRLVGLLNARGAERAVRVLGALAELSFDNAANQVAIAKAGGIPLIVSWLGSLSVAAQTEAAHALLAIASDNASTQQLVVRFAGIPPLITIIAKSSSEKAKEHAARALWHLASSAEVQTTITSEGGVPPLVGMLSAGGIRAPELAAITIVRLAANNPTTSQRIADVGGIGPLCRLLTNGSSHAQQQAAYALAELALLPRNRETIGLAGGINQLIRMLTSEIKGTAEVAAKAIGRLARSSSKGSDEVSRAFIINRVVSKADERKAFGAPGLVVAGNEHNGPTGGAGALLAQESDACRQVAAESSRWPDERISCKTGEDHDDEKRSQEPSLWHEQCDGSVRRQIIREKGGLQRLIAMLEGRALGAAVGRQRRGSIATPADNLPYESHARQGARELPGDESASQWTTGSPAADSSMSDGASMAEEAAAALCDLVHGDPSMQDAVIEAGAIAPLLALFDTPCKAQEHAARCIWHLCDSLDNHMAVVEEGGIGELVGLVRNGVGAAQECAAAAIAELARGGGVERLRRQTEAAILRAAAQARASHASQDESSRNSPGASSRRRRRHSISSVNPPQSSSPVGARGRRASASGAESLGLTGMIPLDPPSDRAPSAAPSAEASALRPPPARTRRITILPAAAPTTAELQDNNVSITTTSTADGSRDSSPVASERENEDENVAGEDDCLAAIAKAGIVPLIAMASNGSAIGKEKAAAALYHLALDKSNVHTIARSNGIPPLASLLDFEDGTPLTFVFAADTLARLSQDDEENQGQSAKRLVLLLSSENLVAQVRGAHALWDLASDQPTSPVAILNAGALLPLVKMLGSGAPEARVEAAGALSTLALNSPQNQLAIAIGLVAMLGTGDEEAAEHVTELLIELCNDSSARIAIAKAGAIHKLVNQLKAKSIRAQELAAATLAALTADPQRGSKNANECAAAGGVGQLISLFEASSLEAQQHAAAVLADMTANSRENQEDLLSSGGIDPLVKMLSSNADADAKADAAGALWSVSTSGRTPQTKIVDAGAVVPLVTLLSETDPRVLLKAAGALAGLTTGHAENQDAISAAGAIKPLVNLLKARDSSLISLHQRRKCKESRAELLAQVQANAASALSELSDGHTSNQSRVADEGGVDLLIALLCMDNDDAPRWTLFAKEMAASALWMLSNTNHHNQGLVAQASGIGPLVELLGSDSKVAQTNAAGALAAMSKDNPENEVAIAAMLVDLLRSDEPPALEKSARAMSRLGCRGESNQAAIAHAGGIPLLVALLSRGVDAMKNHRETLEAREDEKSISSELNSDAYETEEVADGTSGQVTPSPGPSAKSAWLVLRRAALRVTSPPTVAIPMATSEVDDLPPGCLPVSVLSEIASALWSLSDGNLENQRSIADEGGVPPLITMLTGPAGVHRESAGALWALAADETNQELIAESDGIPPLVALLNVRPPTGAQDTAAGALANLARTPQLRAAIANAGGITPLVGLFEGDVAEAKTQAALALATLVLNNEENQLSIAQGLVRVLKSGSLEAQEHVTLLIRDLCLDQGTPETCSFPENRSAIARAGAISHLVRQLKSGTDRAQGLGAEALSLIALRSGDLRVQVTQQLVVLLGAESEEVRKRAGIALREMAAEGGDESQKASAMAGGISPLVALLKDGLADGRLEAQEYALWSLSLVTDTNSRTTIVQEGCIKLLVTCLRAGQISMSAQEHAACVLATVARDSEVHSEIVAEGGIEPLVSLLNLASTGAKKHAANALARLAASAEETQNAIAAGGAIAPLLQWLKDPDSRGASGRPTGLPDLAARALDAIACGNQDTCAQIISAGAVAPLVVMLGAGKSSEVQRSAAGLLATLAEVDAEVGAAVAQEGGIPALVDLLESKRTNAHENATRAIWHLAQSTLPSATAMQSSLSRGIAPLVALLSTGSDATQQYASAAAEALARESPENQVALAKAGAIAPLVSLLASDSPETQEHAVGALLFLASNDEGARLTSVVRRLVGVIDARNASAQMKAASALAVLSSRSVATRTAIMQAGAIPPLVRLLGDGLRTQSDTPQERAAAVLADLARSAEGVEGIVASGGVSPLVQMLASSSERAQIAAASALFYLASMGDNRADIIFAGGIPRFVALLSDGCLEAQRHSAAALFQLSNTAHSKTAIVQAGAIQPLVDMLRALGAKSPEDQDSAKSAEAQESVTAVLSDLARSKQDNKAAIVEAGGIPPLITALSSPSSGVVRHATTLLWALTQGLTSSEYKMKLLDAEAVPLLVALLDKDGTHESQGYAVATLHALAHDDAGRTAILQASAIEPLRALHARQQGGDSTQPGWRKSSWLADQANACLNLITERPAASSPRKASPQSPSTTADRTSTDQRAATIDAALSPHADTAGGQSMVTPLPATRSASILHSVVLEADHTDGVHIARNKLKMRAGCDLDSAEAGDLPASSQVFILEQLELADGTRRALVKGHFSETLGWVSCVNKQDGGDNLVPITDPLASAILVKAATPSEKRMSPAPVRDRVGLPGESTAFVARKDLKCRVACELDSAETGSLTQGTKVAVIERREIVGGTRRALVGPWPEGDPPLGWVTCAGKDGRELLIADWRK